MFTQIAFDGFAVRLLLCRKFALVLCRVDNRPLTNPNFMFLFVLLADEWCIRCRLEAIQRIIDLEYTANQS